MICRLVSLAVTLSLVFAAHLALADDGKKVIIIERTDAPASDGASPSTPSAPESPKAKPSGGDTHRGAKVSASRGVEGGLVVLYPRIIPSTDDSAVLGVADAVQDELARLARAAMPTANEVDVRPAPERTCPKAGCLGVSVGAMLGHSDGACVVVAFVAPPGPSAATVVEWVGKVRVIQASVPFREPIEGAVKIKDFARCGEVASQLGEQGLAVENAIRAIAGTRP